MASSKFTDVSPYVQRKILDTPPATDHLYKSYQKNFKSLSTTNEIGKEVYSGSSKPVGMAIFGLGRAGTIHMKNISRNPRVELLYVVEEDAEKRQKAKEYWNLHNCAFVDSSETDRVLSDPRVTAVVITTPTQTHEALVIRVLASGRAVFCEKPISQNDAATARCYQESKERGITLFCAFNRRFDPAFSTIYERIRSGEVGRVHFVRSCSRDSPLPALAYLKTSGGIFHDCAVHDIDMICWLLGELPSSVQAFAHAHIPEIAAIDDHDTVVISLKFPSGTIASIDISRHAVYGYDERIEVFGTKGMLLCPNHHTMGLQAFKEGGISGEPILHSYPSRFYDAYIAEMEHFLDVIQGHTKKPRISGEETLAVMKIASACDKAARTGVKIDLTWEPHEIPESHKPGN